MGSSIGDALKRAIKQNEKSLDELYKLEKELAEKGKSGGGPRGGKKRTPPEGPLPLVQKYHLAIDKKGRSVLCFDGGKVPLTPRLKVLTEILASDDGPSEDGFVAFKSNDAIRKQLDQQLEKKFTRQNVTNLIYQLRRRLEKGDLSWWVVERSKGSARLRHDGARKAASSETANTEKEKTHGTHLVP